MIRVLHVVTYMGRGGLETMLMNYYRHIDKSKVQFDFVVQTSVGIHARPAMMLVNNCM